MYSVLLHQPNCTVFYIYIKDVSPCFSTSVPFRDHIMPGLKPVGSDKAIIYRILQSVVALLLMSITYT
jgi:hypothetical protein